MTTKHILDGVMQWTGSRTHLACASMLELDPATVCRMAQGRYAGMRIETLDRIQRKTGVPIDTLMDWYRLPDGAELGRVRAPTQEATS